MRNFLNLWLPIFLSNTIIMLGGLFDTIFLSHYSSQHVAALAICLSIYSLVFVSGMGVLQGVMQELAEAKGCNDYSQMHLIIKQSVIIFLVFSIFAALIFITQTEKIVQLLKASHEVALLIQPCMLLLAAALPAHFLLRILYTYTQTCGEAKRVFYANIIFLIVKIFLAYIFIFGAKSLDIPAYGVQGAFIAHLIGQWLVLLIYYAFLLEKALRIHWRGQFFNFNVLLKILKIGLPMAVVVFIDVFAVSAIALLALPLGEFVVNAHQIVLGLCGLMFMVPISLSSAFSIMVSTHIGANRYLEAWRLTNKAVAISTISGISISLFVALLHFQILALFTNDHFLLEIALSLVFLVCWMHIFDALLVITVNMLRCWNVIITPMFIYSGMILILGLGGGWYLAFHPLLVFGSNVNALGIHGFWIMLCIAYTLAAVICLIFLKIRQKNYIVS